MKKYKITHDWPGHWTVYEQHYSGSHWIILSTHKTKSDAESDMNQRKLAQFNEQQQESPKMRFCDLERGSIIKPARAWNWKHGRYIIDRVVGDCAYVVLWGNPSGAGIIRNSSWRSHMYVGQLNSVEIKQFTEFVKNEYG